MIFDYCRIFEGLNNMTMSVKYYREIVTEDSTNVEAIACIGMHHFYTDQPEMALRFYRSALSGEKKKKKKSRCISLIYQSHTKSFLQ